MAGYAAACLLRPGLQAPPPDRDFAEQEIVFIREHEHEIGHCRWAAVVSDPATDELARMVTSRAGMANVEVGFFYDLAAARRWVFRRD
jgi:hypothetical protein